MWNRLLLHGVRAARTAFLSLMVLALCGCSHGPGAADAPAGLGGQKVFDLKEITPERATAILSDLSITQAAMVPGRNAVSVTGTAGDLYRAGVVLELVDTREEFVVETLVPVSQARVIPMNAQIAEAIGGVAIGTFPNPPQAGERLRAIIDMHGQSVIAIVPACIHHELVAFVTLGWEGLRQVRAEDGQPETASTAAPPIVPWGKRGHAL